MYLLIILAFVSTKSVLSKVVMEGCRTDSACNPGEICENTKCIVGCRRDSDCTLDKACINSQCVNPCTTLDACGRNAHCRPVVHRPLCTCQLGYEGNPFDYCQPVPILPPVECVQDKDCSVGHVCEASRCFGTCHRVGPTGKMVCSCPEGYKGSRCDRSLCGCQNGATCIVSRTGYTCRCPTGFTGSHCETFVATNCADMACLHGGTCQVVKGVPTCKCPRGFIGNRCQESRACHNFCHNHATCYPPLNSDALPSCICPVGFVGLRCQTYIPLSPPLAADQSKLMAGWNTALIISLTVAGVLLILVLVGILLYRRKKKDPWLIDPEDKSPHFLRENLMNWGRPNSNMSKAFNE